MPQDSPENDANGDGVEKDDDADAAREKRRAAAKRPSTVFLLMQVSPEFGSEPDPVPDPDSASASTSALHPRPALPAKMASLALVLMPVHQPRCHPPSLPLPPVAKYILKISIP